MVGVEMRPDQARTEEARRAARVLCASVLCGVLHSLVSRTGHVVAGGLRSVLVPKFAPHLPRTCSIYTHTHPRARRVFGHRPAPAPHSQKLPIIHLTR